jgi:hypothetical protein
MNKERKVTASPDDVVLYDSSVRALNGKDPFSEASKILLDMDEQGPSNAIRRRRRDSRECLNLLSRLVEDLKK